MEDTNDEGVTFVTLATTIGVILRDNPTIAQETLARVVNKTMRTAQRFLTDMERAGLIKVNREVKPFQYEINRNAPVPGTCKNLGEFLDFIAVPGSKKLVRKGKKLVFAETLDWADSAL